MNEMGRISEIRFTSLTGPFDAYANDVYADETWCGA